MDIKNYIASGILEAYVLGELTLAEQQEVRAMIDSHPELKIELDVIESSFEALAQSTAVAPSLSLDDLLQDQKLENAPIGKKNSVERPEGPMETEVAEFDQNYYIRSLRTYRSTAIAASLAALIASALALNYYSEAKESENALAAIQTEQEEFAQNYNMVKESLDGIQSDLKIMEDPDNQRIALAGTDNAPDALAFAYWNSASEDLYLNISNLQELADNQQYQLWAIVDGKPVDAGVFDWNSKGLVKMKSFGEGVALFAVTIEPRGGSIGPSLETMQVAGAPGTQS